MQLLPSREKILLRGGNISLLTTITFLTVNAFVACQADGFSAGIPAGFPIPFAAGASESDTLYLHVAGKCDRA